MNLHPKRTKIARKILIKNFEIKSTTTSDEYWAEVLAAHTLGWGSLTEQINHSQKRVIARAAKDLKALTVSDGASHWLKSELQPIIHILQQLGEMRPLHGKQNTSLFTYKVSLIQLCRDIWTRYKNEAPPISYRNEAHGFTIFVSDVIYQIFEYDFTARSAIEAYEKSVNTH